MEHQLIIDTLNRELGLSLSGAYHTRIGEWESWWKGRWRPFHEFKERSGPQLLRREMYSLGMAKKVCEDWAALLLNEQTSLMAGHKKSGEFLQGRDGSGGVLADCDFWRRANMLVEKAFMSGTGAMVLRLRDICVENGRILPRGGKIGVEYLCADSIYPLTVEGGNITEVAFASQRLVRGQVLLYLEIHRLEADGYVVYNRYYQLQNGVLQPQPLPGGVAGELHTGTFIPLFSILRPNLVNNLDDGTGLGLSVFANAIDCLKGVDLAFNNFCRDFKLGGKKVFLNQSLTARQEDGTIVTPDDVAQQLFLDMGNNDGLDAQRLIYEFNPSLRVEENVMGVQAQLDYLSFKCGLGPRHYVFDRSGVVTATQYAGDRQELFQNIAKHSLAVKTALTEIFRAMLWAGKTAIGVDVRPDCSLTILPEDGYVIDREEERSRDREEVRMGLLLPWEYRARWYGETEAQAKAKLLESGVKQ